MPELSAHSQTQEIFKYLQLAEERMESFISTASDVNLFREVVASVRQAKVSVLEAKLHVGEAIFILSK